MFIRDAEFSSTTFGSLESSLEYPYKFSEENVKNDESLCAKSISNGSGTILTYNTLIRKVLQNKIN